MDETDESLYVDFTDLDRWPKNDLGAHERTMPDGSTVEIGEEDGSHFAKVENATLPAVHNQSFDTREKALEWAWGTWQDVKEGVRKKLEGESSDANLDMDP